MEVGGVHGTLQLMDRDGDGNKAVSLKELEAFLTLDEVEIQRATSQVTRIALCFCAFVSARRCVSCACVIPPGLRSD